MGGSKAAGLDRRTFLRTVIGGSAAILGGCTVPRPRPVLSDPVGSAVFGPRLPVPPLAPARADGAVVEFSLVAQRGRSRLVGPGEASTCGYNQAYLGPTLRARRDDQVRVVVRNELGEETTVHWHGMRLPAASDGGPHQVIPAGGVWAPEWTIAQPAATLWYHPHPHEATERQVMSGLAGLFLVDDDRTPPGLPAEYGVDDIPVVLQDRIFDSGGEFAEIDRADETGFIGDTVLVNGAVRPVLDVPRGRVRLRVLNASPARVYHLALEGDRSFVMVASDGGLLPGPVTLDRLVLSPAERAEIVIDVAAGQRLALQTVPVDLGFTEDNDAVEAGTRDSITLMQLRGPATPVTLTALDERLTDDIGLPDATGAQREFVMNGETINDERMDLGRVDLVLPAGAIERWVIRATGDRPHNFHIHDAQFLVESVDGHQPPAHLRGWKDTVLLPVESTAVLRIPVGRYTSEIDPYMFHCHLLLHEDQGMMGQFLVVEPGRENSAPRRIDRHGHG